MSLERLSIESIFEKSGDSQKEAHAACDSCDTGCDIGCDQACDIGCDQACDTGCDHGGPKGK